MPAVLALQLPCVQEVPVVHVLVLSVAAVLLYCSLLAFEVARGGDVLIVLVLAPVLISGAILVLVVASALLHAARWLWRGRATEG